MDAMKIKDEKMTNELLACARAEFAQKGFNDASMRDIASRANVTTGTLYSRFADKNELFEAIVGESAKGLMDIFVGAMTEFASFDAGVQHSDMHTYENGKVFELINYVYDRYDDFKLIICKSEGSSLQNYFDKMIEIETDNTDRFIRDLTASGIKIKPVRRDLSHMLASAMFTAMFETVAHDYSREDALEYVGQVMEFFNAGWDKILGL